MAALCVVQIAIFWDGAMHIQWLWHHDQGRLSPKSKAERFFGGEYEIDIPASLKIDSAVS
jgi:hypothetical protein